MEQRDDMRVWLTVEQVAERWQFAQDTVRKLCQSGRLPATKIAGQWRISLADVEAQEGAR